MHNGVSFSTLDAKLAARPNKAGLIVVILVIVAGVATIGAADSFGLPVSTTHVLSSAVAGTMVANRSGAAVGNR